MFDYAELKGKRAMCSACLCVFSTDSNFDRHRKGEHRTGRRCIYPGFVGLRLKQTASGSVWAMPGMEEANV